MTKLLISLVAVVFASLAAPAFAATDCARMPQQDRARCEQTSMAQAACATLEGDARATCEQKSLASVGRKEDCSKLTGYQKAKCGQQNRAMNPGGACRGKTGANLEVCLDAHTAAKSRAR